MGIPVWGSVYGQVVQAIATTSTQCRRRTMLRMVSNAGRNAGVARPVAIANRNAAMGSIGWLGNQSDTLPCGRFNASVDCAKHITGARTVTLSRTGPGMGPLRGPLRGPPKWPLFGGGKKGRKSAPRGPPGGAPPGAPRRPQKWPKMGLLLGFFCISLGALGGPPGRGGPRGAKKCTFFWVFNNSPSRDKNWPFLAFFGPPKKGPFWGYPGGIRG